MKSQLALGVFAIALYTAGTVHAQTALTGGKAARFVNRTGSDRDRGSIRFAQDPALFTLIDPCSMI